MAICASILDTIRRTLNKLEVEPTGAFFEEVRIPDDLIAGCEDYKMVRWGEVSVEVAMPGWEPEDPVLLLLDDAQRDRLVELTVLRVLSEA